MASKPKKVKKKTNRAAAKRFSLTGSGEVTRGHAKKRHNTGKKSRKRKRHLRHDAIVSRSERRRVTKLIST